MMNKRKNLGRRVAMGACLLTAAHFAAGQVEPGFTPLFNGKNLDGWHLVGGVGPGYLVQGDRIICPADGGGNLFTEKEYANFVLRVDFKLSPGGNNGVGIRAPFQGDAAYQGMEIQVLDDPAPQYKNIRPAQHSGSIYSVFAAKQGALKPTGEWNSYEITAQGRHVSVKLNGTTVVDADLDTMKDPETLRQHPGLARTTGHIGFLGHRSYVEYRNPRIKELP
jgi:3-keto-disaccharide hydrolase